MTVWAQWSEASTEVSDISCLGWDCHSKSELNKLYTI